MMLHHSTSFTWSTRSASQRCGRHDGTILEIGMIYVPTYLSTYFGSTEKV